MQFRGINFVKRNLVAVLLTTIAGFFIYVQAQAPDGRPVENLALPQFQKTNAEILGQNFVVCIPEDVLRQDTVDFLTSIRPGGIVLYARNYSSSEQLKHLIINLQNLAVKTTGYPYFIMIDEEPGGATRLNLFQNVFATGVPDWQQIASDVGILKDVGVNVDLAPVADFPFNKDSFVTMRMAANTPGALLGFDPQFIGVLHGAGLASAIKHFPGMGIFKTDPHQKLPQGTVDAETLDTSLAIFQNGIDSGVDFVMTAHAVYQNIDPHHPATLSSKIIQDILRNKLHFQGLVITDDLSDMPFILDKNMDITQASIFAIEAGQNLLIFSHKNENTREIFNAMATAMNSDRELREFVEGNYRKIISFKQSHDLSVVR